MGLIDNCDFLQDSGHMFLRIKWLAFVYLKSSCLEIQGSQVKSKILHPQWGERVTHNNLIIANATSRQLLVWLVFKAFLGIKGEKNLKMFSIFAWISHQMHETWDHWYDLRSRFSSCLVIGYCVIIQSHCPVRSVNNRTYQCYVFGAKFRQKEKSWIIFICIHLFCILF